MTDSFVYVPLGVSEDDRTLLDNVRRYVNDSVIPARHQLDKVLHKVDFPLEAVERGNELGLKMLALSPEDGGRGASPTLLGLVVEELAIGDLGVAYYFKHNWRFARLIPKLPTQLRREVTERIRTDPWYLPASATTEQESGSDNHVLSDDPNVGLRLRARREGDTWVLNGKKLMITNGSVAGIYFVAARTDPTVPVDQGVTTFAVPADTPGLTFGEPYEKLGQRSSIQTDLYFHDCRIPLDYAVSELGQGMSSTRRGANIGSNLVNAFMSIGVARSAYEEALRWCRNRVQGGVPIYQHQLVAHELGSMKVQIDAARGHALQVAAALEAGGERLEPEVVWGVNVFASEMVVRVARAGMELFGGRGMMAAWPAQKIMRDALTLQHGFGTNTLTLMKIGTAAAERAPVEE